MVVSITTVHDVAHVRFPYDPAAVDIIRTVPGRYWSKAERRWEIDATDVPLAATLFAQAGYAVVINGVPFQRGQQQRTSSADPPLTTFIKSLPPDLRTSVCRALTKVLHPDVGGDTALMQELNRARDG